MNGCLRGSSGQRIYLPAARRAVQCQRHVYRRPTDLEHAIPFHPVRRGNRYPDHKRITTAYGAGTTGRKRAPAPKNIAGIISVGAAMGRTVWWVLGLGMLLSSAPKLAADQGADR